MTCRAQHHMATCLRAAQGSSRHLKARRLIVVAERVQAGPLDCSRSLAAARAAESLQASPLVADPYASTLVSQGGHGLVQRSAEATTLDAIVARFLDEQLLKAVSLVNMERKQEYNQVVIVGDAMDTRPFRLPWPLGTVIYLVGAGEVHEQAEAVLAAQQARVPRGCLLRRVAGRLREGASFAVNLERAGYRGDRLSVWALQGANCFGLATADMHAILADASNLAAFDSLILGELPPMSHADVDNLMAAYGLLGTPLAFEDQPGWERLSSRPQQAKEAANRWLFIAHQKRLSLQQMGIYSDHVAAAEEADEDFFGNFT